METENLTEQISFRVSSETLKRITRLAKDEKRRRADMVRLLFIEGLRVYERQQKEK